MSFAVCPMCHRANREPAKQCGDCGYVFGQSIDTLRGLLKTQLANARAMFWVLLTTELALAGVVALGVSSSTRSCRRRPSSRALCNSARAPHSRRALRELRFAESARRATP